MTGKAKRTKYALEFKLKAIRRVKEKQSMAAVVRHLLK
jgi:transposase-like protein